MVLVKLSAEDLWCDDRRTATRSQHLYHCFPFTPTGGQSVSIKTLKRGEKTSRLWLRFMDAEAGKILREKIRIIFVDS